MLSKFPNSSLKVGAPVSLSRQHTWGGNSSNPVGVRGHVTRKGDRLISVDWDNGRSNNYRKDDYDLICEGEPGFMGVE